MSSTNSGGNGKGAAGGIASIPVASRKVVQSSKEIVNCPQAEIYAMLRECNMDPNETVNRLLTQDPFHEVQRKREKKKEVEMGPRWKGKGSEAKALADPMSKILQQLKCSLIKFEICGLLSGCSVLLEVPTDCIEILNRACIGRPIITAEKEKQWFQLGMEEAFYLCSSLNCLIIKDRHDSPMSEDKLWKYFVSIKTEFPIYYKAYYHLRVKNWVVRSGLQYGVDFVAYRHHPALVHSEHAVLALSEGDTESNGRLKMWSDILCAVRLCGAVAKTLLVIFVNTNGKDTSNPTCLDSFTTEERTITKWSPEQCRESPLTAENGSK